VEPSPFETHGPLAPEDVHGRDELIADLIARVTARRVTALVGPRRYGKTSVLRRVGADLTEVATVWVDLWGTTSVAEVAAAFEDGIAAAGPAFIRVAEPIAASVQLELGIVRASLSRPASRRPDFDALLPSLVSIITTAAARTPTLLVMDEFSAVAPISGVTAKLRTALQHHYRDVGILFAGSEPSTMDMLFTNRAEPFYGQADILRIPLLDAAAAQSIIVDGFAHTGRDAGLTASRAMRLTDGHPHRLMQVADAVWQATPVGETADDLEWHIGVEALRRELDDGLTRLHGTYPLGHQRVLRLVAHGQSPHGSLAGVLDLSAGSATHARESLLAAGDLRRTASGELAVTDPMMADWIRRTFPM
jgi:hypothetical protein